MCTVRYCETSSSALESICHMLLMNVDFVCVCVCVCVCAGSDSKELAEGKRESQ